MDYIDKLVTLSNGMQYIVVENTEYKGIKYVLANEVEDGKLGVIVTLFRVEEQDKKIRFIEESDLAVCENVLSKLTC